MTLAQEGSGAMVSPKPGLILVEQVEKVLILSNRLAVECEERPLDMHCLRAAFTDWSCFVSDRGVHLHHHLLGGGVSVFCLDVPFE